MEKETFRCWIEKEKSTRRKLEITLFEADKKDNPIKEVRKLSNGKLKALTFFMSVLMVITPSIWWFGNWTC